METETLKVTSAKDASLSILSSPNNGFLYLNLYCKDKGHAQVFKLECIFESPHCKVTGLELSGKVDLKKMIPLFDMISLGKTKVDSIDATIDTSTFDLDAQTSKAFYSMLTSPKSSLRHFYLHGVRMMVEDQDNIIAFMNTPSGVRLEDVSFVCHNDDNRRDKRRGKLQKRNRQNHHRIILLTICSARHGRAGASSPLQKLPTDLMRLLGEYGRFEDFY